MTVHPQIRAFLDRFAAAGLTPVPELTPAEARAQMEAMVKARDVPPVPVGAIEEREMPGPGGPLRLRLYRPQGDGTGPLPALVYFHGGGHVIGSLDTHDAVARSLCSGAGCLVASVDYRLAPEHKFPAAAEDAYAAVRWLAKQAAALGADPARLAVGGDSAGANLAAVAALMARDAGGPDLRLQVLVYPLVDYAGETPSYATYATGYGVLEAATMRWFRDHYLSGSADAADWRASPLRAQSLAGVAPALVITAECDVLHDEGVAYAERLGAVGVPVEHRDYAGMIHGFFSLAPMIDDAVAAQVQAVAALRRAFA